MRDLLRRQVLAERQTLITDFTVNLDRSLSDHPVRLVLKKNKTGIEDTARSNFLTGSDGGASTVCKKVEIPLFITHRDIWLFHIITIKQSQDDILLGNMIMVQAH